MKELRGVSPVRAEGPLCEAWGTQKPRSPSLLLASCSGKWKCPKPCFKNRIRLLAARPAGQEFRSGHSILPTTKKLDTWEKQQFFSDPSENWGHRADGAEAQRGRHRITTQAAHPTSWLLPGKRCRVPGEETSTAIDESLETPCAQVWELKIPGDPVKGTPHFCELYLQELS